MARKTSIIRINDKDQKSYGTYYSSEIPRRDSDMYFMAQEGDRCDALAFRFYGDTKLWWFIARANNLKTMNIPAGMHLRIPAQINN